jgi:acetyl-CoA carboxylase carboxyl transferase subunit alpha
MATTLTYDFEKPIIELEQQIEQLQHKDAEDPEVKTQLLQLELQLEAEKQRIYSNLTPWQRVQIARHIDRPHSLDYINLLFTGWVELHGDRGYADDPAVVCGLARFGDKPVAILGQQKGKNTKENISRNFGMMHPEGYRKALRIMKMADKFALPIIILIDTPGAYPGVGAEERGQAEAIARNIKEMYLLRVPILIVIIGEGASGGALGIGLGDIILMMENAWYCVISPEGCASILWRDRAMAPRSAEALKLTAKDLMELGVIDDIIPEPLGGAHRNPSEAAANVKQAIEKHLPLLMRKSPDQLLDERFQKYRKMGVFIEK